MFTILWEIYYAHCWHTHSNQQNQISNLITKTGLTVFDQLYRIGVKLRRFLNYYNCIKPHKGIDNLTPFEKLDLYFKQNM